MELQKAGPVFPKTFSRVVFRISGESVLRYFDPRQHPQIKELAAIDPTNFGNMQEWCQAFVNDRCRPLVISPDCGKTWKIVGKLEVDMFYCDHPVVMGDSSMFNIKE